jgi:hypothetical protein
VELVRELLAEFAVTQRSVSRLLAPDFVWDMGTFRGWPDEPQYKGNDEFNRFFETWRAAYDEWAIEVEDVLDLEDDRVLAIQRQRGRLRGGDTWVDLRFGSIYSVGSEGLVTLVQVYASPEEALEAVGLRD